MNICYSVCTIENLSQTFVFCCVNSNFNIYYQGGGYMLSALYYRRFQEKYIFVVYSQVYKSEPLEYR